MSGHNFQDFGIVTPERDLIALGAVANSLELNRKRRAIEVGSWVGRTAITLADAGFHEVHCIDTWEGSPNDVSGTIAREVGSADLFKAFCSNVEKHRLFSVIHPHHGKSLFYASIWPWQADLIFLDACHDYPMVLADILAWWPHVAPGGILCGHDFGPNFPGVMDAVRETGETNVVPNSCIWWRSKK